MRLCPSIFGDATASLAYLLWRNATLAASYNSVKSINIPDESANSAIVAITKIDHRIIP